MLSDHLIKIPFKHYDFNDFNIQHSRKYYCIKNDRQLKNKGLRMIQCADVHNADWPQLLII